MTTQTINDVVRRRVYPVRAPQNANFPHIVYRLSSLQLTDGLDIDGDTAESQGPDSANFEIRCAATEYDVAHELAGAVLTLLRDHSGVMGLNSSQRCRYIRVENMRDEDVEQLQGRDTTEFVTVVDARVVYDPTEV
jgi:hypothetical protein